MSTHQSSRRAFLKNSLIAAVAAAIPSSQRSESIAETVDKPTIQPNIILYCADQFRADFIGANGSNSSTRTPNLDAMTARGKNFTNTVTNQPVCAPARSIMMTGRYATETGVWRNGPGLDMTLPTLAGELRKAGYSANLIGKWHLSPESEADGGGKGFVRPEHRGGFLDLWEGSNALELTSHPYHGTIWDGDGNPITYTDQYRVDFLTDRAERFLRQKHDKPFFLFISQLEPHQQNDMGRAIGPRGSAERFAHASVPPDLRPLPGTWQSQLPDYYGCCESIDSSVGRLRRILQEENLADDTIFAFISDHGCHFMTRNREYKRSTHNSSIHIPLLIEGPGFNGAQQINELVGMIDLAPTLLDAAKVPIPSTMKGKSVVPLVSDANARQSWPNEQLIQISESMTGRALRTLEWTYCVADTTGATNAPAAAVYHEYQMYDQRADPNEMVNLAGRQEYRDMANQLRTQLTQLMVAAGEPEPTILPAPLYP
jgi:arylsulfatase A-like enzyme